MSTFSWKCWQFSILLKRIFQFWWIFIITIHSAQKNRSTISTCYAMCTRAYKKSYNKCVVCYRDLNCYLVPTIQMYSGGRHMRQNEIRKKYIFRTKVSKSYTLCASFKKLNSMLYIHIYRSKTTNITLKNIHNYRKEKKWKNFKQKRLFV